MQLTIFVFIKMSDNKFIYYLSAERVRRPEPTTKPKRKYCHSDRRESAAECLASSCSGNDCSIGRRTIHQNVKPASMADLYTNIHLCDVQHSSSSKLELFYCVLLDAWRTHTQCNININVNIGQNEYRQFPCFTFVALPNAHISRNAACEARHRRRETIATQTHSKIWHKMYYTRYIMRRSNERESQAEARRSKNEPCFSPARA